jgi:hypothetical protein
MADQARTIRIPVHMIVTINGLARASCSPVQDLGREATAKEDAAHGPRLQGAQDPQEAREPMRPGPDRGAGGLASQRLHRAQERHLVESSRRSSSACVNE